MGDVAFPALGRHSAVVGYANDALPVGNWCSAGSQFLKIGVEAADMKLGDLTPNCTETGGWSCASDYIKYINEDAGVGFQAKYYVWAKLNPAQKKLFDNDESKFTEGWYKCTAGTTNPDFTQLANSEPMNAGRGFLAKSSQKTPQMTIPSAL